MARASEAVRLMIRSMLQERLRMAAGKLTDDDVSAVAQAAFERYHYAMDARAVLMMVDRELDRLNL